MLNAAGCQERRERLWQALPESTEWALASDPRHVCYLCGFWVNPFSFSQGERSLLLLTRDGGAELFADNFTRRSAVAAPLLVEEKIVAWYDHRHSVENRDTKLLEWFQAETQLDPARGIVEDEALPGGYGAPANQGGLGALLRQLRRQKHEDELALLRLCMQATNAGQARALEAIQAGMTEFELYLEVQQAAQRAAGCAAVVYGDFRRTNAETHKAGGMPTNDVLADGDLFLLDYSVVLQGYRSDFTNTLAVGEPSAEQQRLYDTCVEALRAAESQVAPGVDARNVYQSASAVLVEAGYGELAHHAGHGLGLGHPEPPILTPASDDSLLAGDVITLEPGAYVPGVGGVRVEHNYAVGREGCEQLSGHRLSLRR